MLSLNNQECKTPEWRVRAFFADADKEIDLAMRAVGYYHATVKKSLKFDSDCWMADFDIDPGPLVILKNIDVRIEGEARDDQDFSQLSKKFARVGDPLNHGRYEKMKSQIESLALERGYLQGKFTKAELRVDKNANSAQIELIYDSGRRSRFGPVSIHQDILKPEFVEKFIEIDPNAPYSSDPLVETYDNLSKSNYFEQVDIRPDTGRDDLTVPVAINLTPKPKHHYTFGLGFDTDIGPLVEGSYSNRRINRRGHFFDSSLNLSPVQSLADVEYSVPLTRPASDFFSLGAGLKHNDTESFNSTTAKLSSRIKHNFDSGWKQTLYLDYLYEDYTTGTESNSTFLLVPGGSWLRSVADNTLRPTRGHRLEFNISGSYKNPISDVSFIQGSISAVWRHPVPWDGIFIGRTDLGATLVDQFEKLPTTLRFYAGGMNSIRGYEYKELGPKDDLGNVVGGRFLGVISAEYEKAILEDWAIATFVDAGNAFNLDNINVKIGTGLGVRWYSPIGPVRVDFGVPLSESNTSFQIHFAAGSRI